MEAIKKTELVQLVNSEASRLGEFLSGLKEQDWSRNSACADWTLADVAAHLAIAADTWSDSITRGVVGNSDPPPGQAFFTGDDKGSELISQMAISYSQRVGGGLLHGYKTGYDRLAKVMSGLQMEDWDKLCFHRRGPMLVRDYIALRVQELVIHGWDIRSALDQGAELPPEPLPLLVGMVPRWLRNAFRPGLGLTTPVRIRFDVTGPVRIHEDIVVKNDSYQTEAAGSGPGDAVFHCDTGNYLLLIYGRLTIDQAVASGRLTLEGTPVGAADFLAWFQGF